MQHLECSGMPVLYTGCTALKVYEFGSPRKENIPEIMYQSTRYNIPNNLNLLR